MQDRVVDEVLTNANAVAGPNASPLVESLATTVALFEHDLRQHQAEKWAVQAQPGSAAVPGPAAMCVATCPACRTLAVVRKLNLLKHQKLDCRRTRS